ncbi:putative hydrolase [Termitomyces sp. T112]|nr:putative hydrolase [Termitomyces sp. T112]
MSTSSPMSPWSRSHRAITLSSLVLLAIFVWASTFLLSHAGFSQAIDELVHYSGGHFDFSFRTPSIQNKFSWDAVEPLGTLMWHPCYEKLQCARLTVPLNYSTPTGEKAAIALTRFPSSLPHESPDYRGPILINPGGPGGSGVQTVVRIGELLSTVIGPQFDILGFDPRGVGLSTPGASFFETALERELWSGISDGFQVINASSGGLARAWANAVINGKLAWERQPEILGHINTDQTARDMLTIVNAHGREKLSYWGFSYGSVLGATFASMFPNNIERMVIDGVVDIENYYQTLWSTNLIDTSKTMDYFFTSCHAAGPDTCLFHAPTPDLIAANLTKLYDIVKVRPIPVRTSTSYGLVDYTRLRTSIFSSLYKPWVAYPALANALAALAQGDGAPLFSMYDLPKFQCDCGPDSEDSRFGKDAQTTILCNDGDPISSEFETLQEYFKNMMKESEWFEIWANIRIPCTAWPHGPKTRFRGPFKANTSFPILLIGNTADPVTPLWAAMKTAKGFPGAVVLTQDSPGHCSLAAPSICTYSHIRDYFVKGVLPPPGTICPVIGTPFFSPAFPAVLTDNQQTILGETSASQRQTFTREESELYKVVRKLTKVSWRNSHIQALYLMNPSKMSIEFTSSRYS